MHDRKLLLFHFLFNVNMKEASCASDLARSVNVTKQQPPATRIGQRLTYHCIYIVCF